MEDVNPIRTLGDYSKPSHEGYRNTIELPVVNNVMAIDYAAGGRLRKLRPEEAWAIIEKLAQYEDEGWNDIVDPNDGSIDHENSDIEKLLEIMERKVDTLMKDAILLMRRGRDITVELNQLPPEPSRQEEFEHIVMNFILDQEEKVMQL
ncbi:hypothetical protein Tco_0592810, partial [Tanacetum coccineum]